MRGRRRRRRRRGDRFPGRLRDGAPVERYYTERS
jgi:hypothetical protein